VCCLRNDGTSSSDRRAIECPKAATSASAKNEQKGLVKGPCAPFLGEVRGRKGKGPRSFNAMLVTNLSDEARKAVNEAFDAISNWRSETLSNSEKNSGQVIEKMAAAARALGWPEQVVDTTREQLQNITKMQIETLGQGWKDR
jgi:hypothetical protein